jgi:hypothetical protein
VAAPERQGRDDAQHKGLVAEITACAHVSKDTCVRTALRLLAEGNCGPVESFSRESLMSLLESIESAISELRSLNEPRLDAVIARLERRRAEIVAAMAAKGRPEG